LASCTASAAISFPVPLSPSRRRVASCAAIVRSRSIASLITWLRPTSRPKNAAGDFGGTSANVAGFAGAKSSFIGGPPVTPGGAGAQIDNHGLDSHARRSGLDLHHL